jgi:3-carboxy-cis,cis-muconate cycloisomerase
MFERIFVPEEFAALVSDEAWLAALLAAESGLARAEAEAGVIPAEAAEAIAAACRPELFDVAELAEQGRRVANPVEPLVRALTAAVEGDAAGYVHWGATSQDILDTAAMLVVRDAIDRIVEELDAVGHACMSLAEMYRRTPMAGRSLLQHGVPTTFGL